MRFESQTIAIADRKGNLHAIPAMVSMWEDGTPIDMAYHQCPYAYENGIPKFQSWYGLTHLASGTSIGSDEDVEDEAVTRRWLELVAPLVTWTGPAETFRGRASFLRERVEEACRQACEEWQQQGEEVSNRTRPGVMVQEK
ncbi:MAG TPA: hypothetical protein VKB35_11740 [Ktedonobacteraceae bacterium]|nr:hypothetical protein [Ktedonobacteraceae bacterium]